jgi:release factor glutamine methyltransferase
MTVREVMDKCIRQLWRAGIKSPRADVEWLTADTLKRHRAGLNDPTHTMTRAKRDELSQKIKRRMDREPLQHILGVGDFYGYEFRVSSAVLIPRPETETLAELALGFLQPLPSPVALDLGTGSGCIAITLAKRCPGLKVIASDVSESALNLAKLNAETLDALGQVEFRLADALAALGESEQVDLIVSNPPYIPSGDIAGLQPEVRHYDPHLALDGGADGLQFYRLIAAEGQSRLKPDGKLMAEFGDGQESAIEGLFAQADWSSVEITNDLTGQPRIVIASAGQ